jgi:hypothetical protein
LIEDAMKTKFMLCINHGGFPESLEPRKFYEVIEDEKAAAEGMLRVIDESGEDYLYPGACFVEVALPGTLEGQLKAG